MNLTEWDIDYDLKAWAEWASYQSGAKIGYPSTQPFMHMSKGNKGYVPDNWIVEEYAIIIDVVIANLKPFHNDLFQVIELYYLKRKSQESTAKVLHWSVSKVKQKLSVAREVVKGMIYISQIKDTTHIN